MNSWSNNYTERAFSAPGVCTIVTVPSSGTVNVTSTESDIRSPLVKGDRLHALPYWRRIVRPVEVSGTLGLVARSFFVAGGPCLNKPAHEIAGDVTPALFFDAVQPLPLTVDPVMDEFLSGAAVTKALANARSSYNNVPLLIAERRQTLDMITKRSGQIMKGVSAAQRESLDRYIKARKRDKRRVVKDAASWHLEVLFGFLPLIGEIEGLCDQLAAQQTVFITGRGRMRNVATSDSPKVDTRRYIGINNNQNYFSIGADVQQRNTRNASSRTSLRYSVTVDEFQRLRDNGFNPLATAYDLIPLSFLTDFVSNVGMWLRAYDPMFGTEYLTGSTMVLYEDTFEALVTGKAQWTSTWIATTSREGSVKQSGKLFRRVVHPDPPSPTLQWQNNLTPGKLATAAALVVQRYVKPIRALLKAREFRYRGPRPKYLPPIRYRRP